MMMKALQILSWSQMVLASVMGKRGLRMDFFNFHFFIPLTFDFYLFLQNLTEKQYKSANSAPPN